ncbi:hypothetical protein AC1031_021664 [Aphanomyces cochlioides]|nr:hypothetical protein AC1031_021664 [Aphanomyces cochlioides]
MQKSKSYTAELERFMNFLGRSDELRHPTFSSMNLVNITPENIRQYFNLKAFGTVNPSPGSLPVHARSNTLKSMKKKLSTFMPRQMQPWDDIRREGNPTRSVIVNDVIKLVMKCEVRKQGVESKARKPIEFSEFLNALYVVRTKDGYKTVQRYRLGCILTLQWHLIGRVDGMMKLKFENLSFNPSQMSTILCQMRWSKNITEEREAPHQSILASMDDRLCPILNLAIYIELLDVTRDDNVFLFGNGIDGERNVRSLLNLALESSNFKKIIPGLLGTHSIRKGAATYCAKCGVNKDSIELRGLWRGQKKQVDTCCKSDWSFWGCKICLVEPEWFSHEFLSTRIAPNARLLCPELAGILALPLLYASYQCVSPMDRAFPLLPDILMTRIRRAVAEIPNLTLDESSPQVFTNIPIVATGLGGELRLVDAGVDVSATSADGSASTAIMASLCAQAAELGTLKRRFEEVHAQFQNDFESIRSTMKSNFHRLHTSLQRIASMPSGHGHLNNDPCHDQNLRTRLQAKLSKRPLDLYELWKEYEFGLAGSIPAKQFSEKERGAVKFTFCFRAKLWRLVEAMLKRGYTSDTAIDAVYAKFGRSKSVSAILTELRRFKLTAADF